MLYSADPLLSTLAPLLDTVDESHFELNALETEKSARNVVIVLSNVDDSNELIASIRASSDAQNRPEIYHVDAGSDSLESISSILSGYSELESVQIISHGSDARIKIGDAHLDSQNVDSYQSTLEKWALSLSDTGDLLFFGCDIASSSEGKALIDRIAAITGADVGASTDLTGHARFGGNWELEYATGVIDSGEPLLSERHAAAWENLLAVINVTTFDDITDAPDTSSIGALLSNPGVDGVISLREAIEAANASDSQDEIVLAAGNYVLWHADGDLELLGELTITGQGMGVTTIDANGIDRVFSIADGTNTISGVTITGGHSSSGAGGGILITDGILNLVDVSVEDNETLNAKGGAIRVDTPATLSMTDSQIVNNIAGVGANPVFKDGGAIHTDGTTNLTRVLVENNDGKEGGGIHNGGTLTIVDSWFKNNRSSGDGGAISHQGGDLTIERTTFNSNLSSGSGGALSSDGDLSVSNSTFSGNTASGDGGAAVVSGGNTRFSHSSFVGNSASGRGGALDVSDSPEIQASLFMGNSGVTSPVEGAVTSLGFNLTHGMFQSGAVATDLQGQAAVVGPLQDNGGYAPTHALLAGSPAINAGPGGGGTDATGAPRNAISDIGAMEYQTNVDTDKLYWGDSNTQAIYRANPDGTAVQKIIDTSETPFDIEIDWEGERIYWIESEAGYLTNRGLGELKSADLDGTNITTLKSGIKFPTGIALNLVDGKIYITSDETPDNTSAVLYINRILELDLDGSNERVLYAATSFFPQPYRMVSPVDLEYDADTQYLYWSDRGSTANPNSSEIKRLKIGAGTAPELVHDVTSAVGDRAFGFTLVPGADQLYWATGSGVNLLDYSANTNVSTLTSANDVFGVQFSQTENRVYVADQGGGIRSFVPGSSTTQTIVSYAGDPFGIAVARIAAASAQPTLDQKSGITLDEGDIAGITTTALSASDSDNTDAEIQFTIAVAPTNGSLENSSGASITQFTQADLAAGDVFYRHDGGESTSDAFEFTLSDGTSLSVAERFNITVDAVNDRPIAMPDSITVVEGSNVSIPILLNDSDVDGILVPAAIAISGPGAGSIMLDSSGNAQYTHDGSETTSDSFTYTVEDNSGAVSAPTTVSITVTPQNDAPVVVNDNYTLAEGGSSNYAIVSNDTDADSAIDPASIVITSGPSNGSVVIKSDGSIDYTHDGSETNSDSLTYTIADSAGAVSATGSVSFTIAPVNDNPVAQNDNYSVVEGNSLNLNLSANDTDPDDGLDVSSINIVTMPTNGGLLVLGDGSVEYMHDGSETTSDSFTYTITDLSGQVSAPATVSLTITPANDPPVAVDDNYSLSEGGTIDLPVLANDTDAENGIDSTTVTIVSGPGNGPAVVQVNGEIRYSHDGSETTSDTLTYVVSDGSGSVSAPATVNLMINPQNDSPVANNDSFTVDEGVGSLLSVLANDQDADDGLDAGSVVIVAGPANGTVNVKSDGTVDYIHDGSETAADSFSYIVSDLEGNTSPVANVVLSIVAVNDQPQAIDDNVVVDEGGSQQIDILANDLDVDDDLDSMVIDIITSPEFGEFLVSPDGSLNYQHDGSETTQDQFSYTLTDASGETSSVATVTININTVNDAPVALPSLEDVTVTAGEAIVVPPDTFTDVDNSELTVSATLPSGDALPEGLQFDPDTATFIIQDTAALTFPLDILLTATDDDGESASVVLSLNSEPEPELGAAGEQTDSIPEPPIAAAQSSNLPVATDNQVASPVAPATVPSVPPDVADLVEKPEPLTDFKISNTLPDVEIPVMENEDYTQHNIRGDRAEVPGEQPVDAGDLKLFSLPVSSGVSLATLFAYDQYEQNPTMRSLQEYFEDNSADTAVIDVKVATSVTATSVVSIGYVLWVIRGGVLLSSMLTALPAWRFLDPIPVLSSFESDEEEDDESLNTMVASKPGRAERIKARLKKGRDSGEAAPAG